MIWKYHSALGTGLALRLWHLVACDHQSVTILTTPLDAQIVVGDRVQPLIPGTVSLNRKEVLRRLEWVNEGASSSPTPQQASGIKDLFTCEVVGHTMGARMTADLVSDALRKAVGTKRPRPGLIHHSDRRSQYCAQDYQAQLRQFGMTASMSRKGNCYDNAPMESFWGTLKNELVHHRRYATREQPQREITEYIELFYNRQRRHSRLGNCSPAAFALQWARQQPAA